MGIDAIFEPTYWAAVPFHFWSLVFFCFGCIVGSFLNVCIHRMPLDQSVISPPSHCPHCKYSIPWYLNIPLATWLWLRGRCANCGAPISVRYFLVELVTGVMFLVCWVAYGQQSAWLALVYCLFMAGLIVATFVDFEHFIIPDEITIGGFIVGFLISLVLPELHGAETSAGGLARSGLGIAVGGGVIYAILRMGKLLFGRQKIELGPDTRVIFTESSVLLPDQEVPYHDLFYRKSDAITLEGKRIELIDRSFPEAVVRLSPISLRIADEEFDPETVHHMEVTTSQIVFPREAMGFGDVKFMAAIGAFLGASATLFSLMLSSVIGAMVGVGLIVLQKREWSSRLPYGPYIAVAAAIWVLCGPTVRDWWNGQLHMFWQAFQSLGY
jgi:leader peptidase (prepilin peptidase)/N-methyltransferase